MPADTDTILFTPDNIEKTIALVEKAGQLELEAIDTSKNKESLITLFQKLEKVPPCSIMLFDQQNKQIFLLTIEAQNKLTLTTPNRGRRNSTQLTALAQNAKEAWRTVHEIKSSNEVTCCIQSLDPNKNLSLPHAALLLNQVAMQKAGQTNVLTALDEDDRKDILTLAAATLLVGDPQANFEINTNTKEIHRAAENSAPRTCTANDHHFTELHTQNKTTLLSTSTKASTTCISQQRIQQYDVAFKRNGTQEEYMFLAAWSLFIEKCNQLKIAPQDRDQIDKLLLSQKISFTITRGNLTDDEYKLLQQHLFSFGAYKIDDGVNPRYDEVTNTKKSRRVRFSATAQQAKPQLKMILSDLRTELDSLTPQIEASEKLFSKKSKGDKRNSLPVRIQLNSKLLMLKYRLDSVTQHLKRANVHLNDTANTLIKSLEDDISKLRHTKFSRWICNKIKSDSVREHIATQLNGKILTICGIEITDISVFLQTTANRLTQTTPEHQTELLKHALPYCNYWVTSFFYSDNRSLEELLAAAKQKLEDSSTDPATRAQLLALTIPQRNSYIDTVVAEILTHAFASQEIKTTLVQTSTTPIELPTVN